MSLPYTVFCVINFSLSVSLAMEAIGDITASAEVSRVQVDGEEFDSRIQGGILVGCSPVEYQFTHSLAMTVERWSRWLLLSPIHSHSPVDLCSGVPLLFTFPTEWCLRRFSQE